MVYLVRLSIIELVGVTVILFGPLHIEVTFTGISTAELNSTVQVRMGEDPAIMGFVGGVIVTVVGAGTA